jgi:hypothetical protein
VADFIGRSAVGDDRIGADEQLSGAGDEGGFMGLPRCWKGR